MSHCTGPYTRIPFARSDIKAAKALVDGLRTAKLDLTVIREFDGNSGLDDFNLDLEIADAHDNDMYWDLRAAKFLGPKKTLRKSFVFEIAMRKRAKTDNAVQWEGFLFDTNFKALAKALPTKFLDLLAGNTPAGLVDGDDAQLHRIELCTGTAI